MLNSRRFVQTIFFIINHLSGRKAFHDHESSERHGLDEIRFARCIGPKNYTSFKHADAIDCRRLMLFFQRAFAWNHRKFSPLIERKKILYRVPYKHIFRCYFGQI